jgi:hypothetical protein
VGIGASASSAPGVAAAPSTGGNVGQAGTIAHGSPQSGAPGNAGAATSGTNGGFGGSPDAVQQAAQACARELAAGRACGAQSYYLLQAIYFNGKLYKSKADCLTAAHAARLPLDLCP